MCPRVHIDGHALALVPVIRLVLVADVHLGVDWQDLAERDLPAACFRRDLSFSLCALAELGQDVAELVLAACRCRRC